MPRTSQFVPKGATAAPNTPNHHPLVDQPNTPAMEASAQAMAIPADPNAAPGATPHSTPVTERTKAEMDIGRSTVERHAAARDEALRASGKSAEPASDESPAGFDMLDDGTPIVKDVGAETTPVTLEDGSQARVPRPVADAARAADRARSADLGTGKFPRGVDPRDPAVRAEEASADPDRNTLKGPASTGVKK